MVIMAEFVVSFFFEFNKGNRNVSTTTYCPDIGSAQIPQCQRGVTETLTMHRSPVNQKSEANMLCFYAGRLLSNLLEQSVWPVFQISNWCLLQGKPLKRWGLAHLWQKSSVLFLVILQKFAWIFKTVPASRSWTLLSLWPAAHRVAVAWLLNL